jgi:hypothetical protein
VTNNVRHFASAVFFRRALFGISTSVLLVIFLLAAKPVRAEEDLEMINRPVNTAGLTGLLFTTTPFTLLPRAIEISAYTVSENSVVPNYTVTELPGLSITAGIGRNSELAVKGYYVRESLNQDNRKRGAGDTEVSYKWNFLPQTENSPYPAAALFLTCVAPTGSKDLNVGGVAHWGAKIGLSLGREITWGDRVVGVYADGQIAVHDLSDDRFSDRYSMLNAGILYPISKYRNLQILIEYNGVSGVDRLSDVGGDYTAITYGLRLVTEKFNLTIGTQFLRKKEVGFDDTSKVIGTSSIKF